MNIDQALISYLLGTSNLTQYVSTKGVFKNLIPQGQDLPVVCFTRISAPREHTMLHDPKIYSPHYQFEMYSTSQSQLGSIVKALTSALEDYSGVMGGTSGVNVQRIFLESDGIDYTDIDPVTNQITFKKISDFIIWHTT